MRRGGQLPTEAGLNEEGGGRDPKTYKSWCNGRVEEEGSKWTGSHGGRRKSNSDRKLGSGTASGLGQALKGDGKVEERKGV